MNILNKTQLLPGICKSLKTTIIRQHELCARNSEKHSSLLPVGEIKDLWVATEGKKIPYANRCVYVVNIITPTLKAHISHKEKLNFCNYPIIKPLLNKSREPKPFIFKCQSGSTAVTIPAQKGARQGLVIPSLETQNITAQIWVSVPLLVGLLLDHLCTAALPEKKIQPLHLLNKVGRKKKRNNPDLQSFNTKNAILRT